ncbi:MAG: DUF4890 domain-containing protein [Bacteroidetes bacterium]|nr:DUF4890 domain-containing protein [Bacteroidota bacterium]
MKKIVLTGIVIGGIIAANAQQAQTPGKSMDPKAHAAKQTEKMALAIGLNESSKAKVYDINYNSAQKMAGIREKHKGDKKGMAHDRLKLKSEKDCQLRSVLTAEQYDKWIDVKLKQKKHARNKKRAKHQRHHGTEPISPLPGK